MKVKKNFSFRKTKANGTLSGTSEEYQVPDFEWEEFIKLPNARLFAKRSYDSTIQKLVRDILLEKNGTSDHHLQTMESVIARSITFTKQEIIEWCNSRDWELTQFNMDKEKAIQLLNDKLPAFALDENSIIDKNVKTRIAEIIAGVSDINTDPVAEYLWAKLTQESSNESSHLLDLL